MLTIIDPLLVIIAVAVCVHGLLKRSKLWMMGQDGEADKTEGNRLIDLIVDTVIHKRILKDPLPGLMHLAMFAACLVPLLVIIVMQINFLLPDAIGAGFSVILDIIGLIGLVGIIYAAFRRYILRPDRLDDTKAEDALPLIWLFAIIFIGFCIEGLRIEITGQGAATAPVGTVFSLIFAPLGDFNGTLHSLLWRVHFFLVLGMIAVIPYTKFIHIIVSPISVYLRKYGPIGDFSGIDFETAETYGAAKIEEFTKRQLLHLDACLRCGRCQDNCPTHLSEKPLSPKKLIQDLKKNMEDKAAGNFEEGKLVIGDVIDHDTIWACTMCLNCTEHCPVCITTADKTIELRRYLVMTDPNFPSEAQTVFKNMENNSNPWGIGSATRGDWAKELGVPTAAEAESFDILLYTGCAGAFDDRYKKVTIAVSKILQKAGVNFAILGAEESCCGDSARRLGNEYLFDTLAQANVAAFDGYKVKKILTICPHCLNTFKNEYYRYNGNYEVVHHTEFILDLVKSGKIKLNKSEKMKVCYHDSCFLGRYNNIYEQPRELLKSVSGVSLVEMDRNMNKSFCCGAGGGRMWLEEDIGQRINEMRTDQALEKNPDTIATGCPYCLTMLDDGIKAREKQESVKSLDIAEIILNAME
jgi:Fe-S oxidoreductase/nitrate reductase gamma subunit